MILLSKRWFSSAWCLLLSLSLLLTMTMKNANANVIMDGNTTTGVVVAYTADITEIPGTNSGVSGTVVVFVDSTTEMGTLGYTGMASGLQPNLDKLVNCTAVNGCGVHVHNGTSCDSTETQGGHFFVAPVTQDPWVNERYSSHSNGDAWFGGVVNVGDAMDVTGLPFIIHAQDGSRVACGILEPISTTDDPVLTTTTTGFGETPSSVTSFVTAVPIGSTVCFYGQASGLEPNLMSWMYALNATDCTATNGCGVHFHAGYDCSSSDTQIGHLFNADVLGTNDPWAMIDYPFTDADGNAKFANCVDTAQEDFVGHAFVIHSNDGSRVSCGIMMNDNESSSSSSSPSNNDGNIQGTITDDNTATSSNGGGSNSNYNSGNGGTASGGGGSGQTSGSVVSRRGGCGGDLLFVGGGMMMMMMMMMAYLIET